MRMFRVLGALLLLAAPGAAQGTNPVNSRSLTAVAASCTASSTGCLIVGTTGSGGLGVDIRGTFTATVQFEGLVSSDTTKTWVAVNCTPYNSTTAVTSTTATGSWGCAVGGLSFFRVRVSAYTSGTIDAVTRTAATLARSFGGGGAPGGADTQVQFNSAGSFSGSSELRWASPWLYAPSAEFASEVVDSSDFDFGVISTTATPNGGSENVTQYVFAYSGFFEHYGTGTVSNAISADLSMYNYTSGTIVSSRVVELYAENYSGTWTTMDGARAILRNGTGAVGKMRGFVTGQPGLNSGNYDTGTVSEYNGFYSQAVNNFGTYGAVYGLKMDDQAGLTVSGANHAINYADKFIVDNTGFMQLVEQTEPAAGAANSVRIYAKDTGGGKTTLCARFSSGAAQCFATEP